MDKKEPIKQETREQSLQDQTQLLEMARTLNKDLLELKEEMKVLVKAADSAD